ncbi:MAG: phytanoyl-CoA dioxygenase family protein [Alphaproteobacteria bacterium]
MREEFNRQGFVFRPGLLPQTDARALTEALDSILAREPDDTRLIREKDGTTPRTLVNPHLWHEVYGRLVRHPVLLDAAEAILGEPVYAWQMGVNCKAAFAGDAWFWHQDYPAYRADDHIAAPRMVNTLIFLDEVTSLNGPLMLVPGSQEMADNLPDYRDEGTSYTYRYTERELIEAEVRRAGVAAPTGPAGSVIFMHVNLLHGSAGNISPWPRRMVTLTYNAISNKATSRSTRPAHIVPDDRDVPALTPLGADCLAGATT